MKFTWDAWDFDLDGEAYIIAKRVCPEKADVPGFIIREDHISPVCASDMVVQEGWCKFQCRTDWETWDGHDNTPRGGYVVETHEPGTRHPITGKRVRGWFPVWIVRKDEWY